MSDEARRQLFHRSLYLLKREVMNVNNLVIDVQTVETSFLC